MNNQPLEGLRGEYFWVDDIRKTEKKEKEIVKKTKNNCCLLGMD